MKVFQNLKNPLLLGTGIGALAIFFFFYSPPSVAAPTINWVPSQVSEAISPGASTTTSVSFTASKNLNNVVVRVVPELEPYLEVNPAAFSSINKGQTYNLDLNISAPADALLGTFDGTVQLRSGSDPKKAFAKQLPVTIAIEPAGSTLPPDPGEAGKATLEGIDSDGDGVRDDIQRYIALTYPNSEKTRAALTQYAKAYQKTLLDASDEGKSISNTRARLRAMDCLKYIHGHDEGGRITFELRAEYLNTDDRSIAYIRSNEHFGGEYYPSIPIEERKTQCEFDPDAIGG